MGWTIREATASDIPRIVETVNLAYRVEDFFKIGDRTDAAEITACFASGTFLVAEDAEGRLAGCVYFEQKGSHGHFGMLSARPGNQGRGLGRFLIDQAEARAKRLGLSAMDLDVVELRLELIPWYTRLGYVETGRAPFSQPGRTRIPCEFIQMSKPLIPGATPLRAQEAAR